MKKAIILLAMLLGSLVSIGQVYYYQIEARTEEANISFTEPIWDIASGTIKVDFTNGVILFNVDGDYVDLNILDSYVDSNVVFEVTDKTGEFFIVTVVEIRDVTFFIIKDGEDFAIFATRFLGKEED